jgi:predicted enzyme related to lactoylglutathione lyase
MLAQSTQQAVAGVSHARGSNAQLPPQWLIYVAVDDLDASLQRCLVLGGSVVDGPRALGVQRFCVIRDPAGAVMALVGPQAQAPEV